MSGLKSNAFVWAHKHDVVWMSQNTNHLPTDPAVQEAIKKAVDDRLYNGYPLSSGLPGLPEAILKDLGLGDEYKVLLSSGGTEALYIAFRAFLEKGDQVITGDPSYMILHHFIRLGGATPMDLPCYQAPWHISVEQIKEAITPKTKMILFIDPLNPLGSSYTKDEVRAVCDLAKDHDIILFDDITYRDYADEHHLTTEFAPEKTLIAFSLSKTCGFAGMRTGALVTNPALMEKAATYNTNDLSINILGQVGAKVALETKPKWFPGLKAQALKNQAIIKEAVDKVEGCVMPVYPSQANMFVVDVSATGADPTTIQDKMLYEHNVFIRGGSYLSKKFGDRFVRISFTVPEDGCRRFAKAFPAVMEEVRKKGGGGKAGKR